MIKPKKLLSLARLIWPNDEWQITEGGEVVRYIEGICNGVPEQIRIVYNPLANNPQGKSDCWDTFLYLMGHTHSFYFHQYEGSDNYHAGTHDDCGEPEGFAGGDSRLEALVELAYAMLCGE